jgi:hypothetical protein
MVAATTTQTMLTGMRFDIGLPPPDSWPINAHTLSTIRHGHSNPRGCSSSHEVIEFENIVLRGTASNTILVTRASWGTENSKRSDALRTDILFNLLSPRGNVRYEWTCGQRMESPFNLATLLADRRRHCDRIVPLARTYAMRGSEGRSRMEGASCVMRV